MVFYWRLSDWKVPQVSRTLLNILAVFNNTVVGIISTRLPTFKYSMPFNNPLVTVPKAPITIGIIVTFMFQFFQFSSKIEVLISRFTFFQFYSVDSRDSKVDNFGGFLFFFFFFLLIIIKSGIIIIIIILQEIFFTSVLTDSILLENEWQQISSELQDSSQYSNQF